MSAEGLYFEAAKVLIAVRNRKGSIKGLCFKSRFNSPKKLFALTVETSKQFPRLHKLVSSSGLLDHESILTLELACVLCFDFLCRKGIRCGGKLKAAIHRHKDVLRQLWKDLKESDQAETHKDEIIYKYVRVNPLRSNTKNVSEKFKAEMDIKFEVDDHIPHVLRLTGWSPSLTKQMVDTGEIVIQDKASCMPAEALSPPNGAYCIDACAAPGNKTTHLAALIGNKGQVFAFDINPSRAAVLQKTVNRTGADQIVTVHNEDFLATDPAQYPLVTHILCDPSCSGSGIINRTDATLKFDQELIDEPRLRKLSSFQAKIVNHAMKFPNVQRISYSTCSIHAIENELVVATVLAENPCFELAKALPQWPHRGVASEGVTLSASQLDCLVRCDPLRDETHGFFVAVFQRKEGHFESFASTPNEEPQNEKGLSESVVPKPKEHSPRPKTDSQKPVKRKNDTPATKKKKRKRGNLLKKSVVTQ